MGTDGTHTGGDNPQLRGEQIRPQRREIPRDDTEEEGLQQQELVHGEVERHSRGEQLLGFKRENSRGPHQEVQRGHKGDRGSARKETQLNKIILLLLFSIFRILTNKTFYTAYISIDSGIQASFI